MPAPRLSEMRFIVLFVLIIFCAGSSGVLGQSENNGIDGPQTTKFGIVVDNSGTFRLAIDRAIQLLSPFVREKSENSEGFLVVYSEPTRVVLRQELTEDAEELVDALANMYGLPGRSAVWDAIGFAAEQFGKDVGVESERRILIVLTDGDEKGSVARPSDVLKKLSDRGIEVFVIGIAEQRVSERMIDRLVRDTGGKKLLARNQDELLKATAELTETIWRGKSDN